MTGTERRLADLLGAQVVDEDGRPLGRVNDVRLAPTGAVVGRSAELAVEEVIVAPRFTGSLLGYDRRPEQGPWLVRRVVALLHRHACSVPWGAVVLLDWEGSRMVVDGRQQRPLRPPGD